jgi:hypothetical protein
MLVQSRCSFLAALLFTSGALFAADEKPDAREILRGVRIAQGNQDRNFTGQIRTGPRKVPFKLSMHEGTVRWEFDNPRQAIVLRLGEKSATLEEVTPDGKAKVGGARMGDSVRGSDITFEDLSMHFLYWPNATLEGEETIMLTRCWKLLVSPASSGASIYSRVRIWAAKETGALLKCEAFGKDGTLARTFSVRSGQKTRDGIWMLKQMRIETAGGRGDRDPTYIEIDSDR